MQYAGRKLIKKEGAILRFFGGSSSCQVTGDIQGFGPVTFYLVDLNYWDMDQNTILNNKVGCQPTTLLIIGLQS